MLVIINQEKNYHVDLLSRKLKVDLNKEFISEINSVDELSLSIN